MHTGMPVPQTQYAVSDDLSIAYQVFGQGAVDLVFVPGIVSHVEMNWEDPAYARMLRALGAHFRVIMFDKRGQGLSDRFEGVPTLEERMDDVRDVMRAVGSTRAVLLAYSEGGPMGALFTATYPEMVERLILLSSMARLSWAPDYPHRPTIEQILQHTAATWGKPEGAQMFAPSRVGDADFGEGLARYQRQSSSPSAIKRLHIANDQIDVRAILPQVRRPTLIVHRRRDRAVNVAHQQAIEHCPTSGMAVGGEGSCQRRYRRQLPVTLNGICAPADPSGFCVTYTPCIEVKCSTTFSVRRSSPPDPPV